MGFLSFKNEHGIEVSFSEPKLEYISYLKDEGDWSSIPHSHNFVEIEYIIEGFGNVLIDDKIFPVKKDDLIIIPENRLHTEFSSSSSSLECYIIGINNFSIHKVSNEEKLINQSYSILKNANLDNSDTPDDYIKNIFSEMFIEMKNKNNNYELVVHSLLLKLCVYVIREFKPSPDVL